jgi:hypothetical protein
MNLSQGTSKYGSSVNNPMDDGSVPLNWFKYSIKVVNLVRHPIVEVSFPGELEIDKCVRLVSNPICIEIRPSEARIALVAWKHAFKSGILLNLQTGI